MNVKVCLGADHRLIGGKAISGQWRPVPDKLIKDYHSSASVLNISDIVLLINMTKEICQDFAGIPQCKKVLSVYLILGSSWGTASS